MYLDVTDSSTLPYGWSRYAQFSLAVVNQVQNKYSIRKGVFFTIVIVLSFYSSLCVLSFFHLRQRVFCLMELVISPITVMLHCQIIIDHYELI